VNRTQQRGLLIVATGVLVLMLVRLFV